jgi:two-component system phosphate regulon response regulator OmpR
MLTAMGEPEDRIVGLEHGVDDYLTKPFEPRELVLRLHAILRRVPSSVPPPAEIRMGEIVFVREREELRKGDQPIRLTDVEAALLKALTERPNEILSREELSVRTGASGGGRAVDVQVTRLRRKIEPDPRLPRYLQTVRGRGYVLRPD